MNTEHESEGTHSVPYPTDTQEQAQQLAGNYWFGRNKQKAVRNEPHHSQSSIDSVPHPTNFERLNSMNLLPQFRDMLAFIDSKVDGLSMSNTSDRNIVSGTLFDAANEHAKGICTLLEHHLYASAFALERTLFETFVRGAWLLHCATENEVNTFLHKDKIELDSKENFPFGDMITAIESTKKWPKTLSEIKSHAWNALNSYTHGGQHQVLTRYNGSTIGACHDPEQVDEVIRFSAMLTFLAFTAILDVSDTKEADKDAMKLLSQIRIWCFNKPIP
jgi:hypothetical protein